MQKTRVSFCFVYITSSSSAVAESGKLQIEQVASGSLEEKPAQSDELELRSNIRISKYCKIWTSEVSYFGTKIV